MAQPLMTGRMRKDLEYSGAGLQRMKFRQAIQLGKTGLLGWSKYMIDSLENQPTSAIYPEANKF